MSKPGPKKKTSSKCTELRGQGRRYSPSKAPGTARQPNPRYWGAENPGDGASIVSLATAFDNALGQVSFSRNHSEVPELPVENPMESEGSCWQPEDIHPEEPAPQNGPNCLDYAQPQAFARPDFRFADPESDHDKASIQYALFFTREDYRARLGVKTMGIRTTPGKCYASQWLEIQRRFSELWPLRGDGEAPVLVQLEAWTGNFDNWKDPA